MKVTKHVSFFYIESRICYVNKIINETNIYEVETDIYIHTNNENLTSDQLNKYENGSINIVCHDLSNIHPYYLTWKCRDLMKQQKDEYDIFMYIEDDILVPYKAIKYWLKYNESLIDMNYNLGFVRIEVKNNEEYITDLMRQQFDTIIKLNGEDYCINNKNPYCAFWIYNKKEFNRFVDSKYYNINNIPGYETREKSAIGLHGNTNYWYRNTVIPLSNKKLHEDCRIYHLPNNYVAGNPNGFATIKFNDAVKI